MAQEIKVEKVPWIPLIVIIAIASVAGSAMYLLPRSVEIFALRLLKVAMELRLTSGARLDSLQP